MKASYTLKLADYSAALRLHRRQKFSRRLNHFLWFVATPALAVSGAIAFIVFDLNKVTHFAPLLFGIECALVWISVYLPAWRYYSARKCVKQVFQEAGKDRTFLIEVTDESIHSTIPGVSDGKHFWRKEVALAYDEKVVLIYVAKMRFIPIPASSLSEIQMEELRAIFERNMVKI